MKITGGKRVAIIGFCIFLGFMAVCTVAAKGIYRSGLPRVTTQKAYNASLTHVFEATGTVRQGQEYGLFVESGLRVATVAVRNGEIFETGRALFQVDTADLESIIEERRLALEKLKSQQAAEKRSENAALQERKSRVTRAKEDYEDALKEADARIAQREQSLEAAQWALARFDQYLSELSRLSESDVSGGNLGPNPAQEYNLQVQRQQLVQAVVDAANNLEAAKREKENGLKAANRAIEDAERANYDGLSSAKISGLDLEYQEKRLKELEALLESDGWVTAQMPGQVLEVGLAVGERTRDGAAIVYAMDDGSRVIEATFDGEAFEYIEVGKEITMQTSDGQSTVPITYIESTADENMRVLIFLENQELPIGQTVELSYRAQSENYSTCVPQSSLLTDGRFYVFVAQEWEGILGTEWHVKKVYVNVVDQTDTMAAISSVEITGGSRVVISYSGSLTDGAVVRVVDR